MLKGSSKAAIEENTREIQNKGLSERDAVLVSMKRSKKEQKEYDSVSCAPSGPNKEDYPYGLRIELDNETMQKLGLDEMPEVGEIVKITAQATVKNTSESQYEHDEEPRRSLSLQITKLAVEE